MTEGELQLRLKAVREVTLFFAGKENIDQGSMRHKGETDLSGECGRVSRLGGADQGNAVYDGRYRLNLQRLREGIEVCIV